MIHSPERKENKTERTKKKMKRKLQFEKFSMLSFAHKTMEIDFPEANCYLKYEIFVMRDESTHNTYIAVPTLFKNIQCHHIL